MSKRNRKEETTDGVMVLDPPGGTVDPLAPVRHLLRDPAFDGTTPSEESPATILNVAGDEIAITGEIPPELAKAAAAAPAPAPTRSAWR